MVSHVLGNIFDVDFDRGERNEEMQDNSLRKGTHLHGTEVRRASLPYLERKTKWQEISSAPMSSFGGPAAPRETLSFQPTCDMHVAQHLAFCAVVT